MGTSLDAATGTSPGVRLREDLSYEPMLHVGLEHGGSLGEGRSGMGGSSPVGQAGGAPQRQRRAHQRLPRGNLPCGPEVKLQPGGSSGQAGGWAWGGAFVLVRAVTASPSLPPLWPMQAACTPLPTPRGWEAACTRLWWRRSARSPPTPPPRRVPCAVARAGAWDGHGLQL